jgi:exonuclease III
MGEHMKLVSMNVRGLGDRVKRNDVFSKIKEQHISIACLQDTHFDIKLKHRIKSEWGLRVEMTSSSSNSRGVAVLFNNNFEYTVHKVLEDPQGNYIIIDLTIANCLRLTLANIYGPNSDDPVFYSNLQQKIDGFENNSILICGDWNLVLDPAIDTYNYKHVNNPNAREAVIALATEKELVDVWRSFHETDRQYTWHHKHPIKMSRLDFVLVSEDIMSVISNSGILPKYKSDHSPVMVEILISKHTRGKGYWKFNNSLLKEVEFVKMIKQTILDTKTQYAAAPHEGDNVKNCPNKTLQLTINDQLFWETLLVMLRGKIMAFAGNKKRKDAETEACLNKQIEEIDAKIKMDPNNYVDNIEQLESLNNELEQVRKQKIDGMIIRSRVKWTELGEKSTKFFCNLENKNYINKSIQELKQENGKIIVDQKQILKEQQAFYKTLYSENKHVDCSEENIVKFVDLSKVKSLSTKDSNSCEGPITYNELLVALKKSKNNKSPGNDGYTTEFFKFFWIDLGHFLLRSINFGYSIDQMSSSQRRGLITCLPKPGKPRCYLKNWRPITLLNTSYKLAAACIAERIKSNLNQLINEDQKGFLPGRFIGENTRLIYDIIFESKAQEIPGMIMMIDFEKAFDTVSWEFIQRVLDIFNFGASIKKWVKLFQNKSESNIISNGHFSTPFTLERGCRQGDPISPYIFVLCVEILGIAVRQNKQLKGIDLWGEEFTINQYADDTYLFLDGSEQSMSEAYKVLDWFYEVSGLKANIEKTKVLWIGSMEDSDRRFCRENCPEWITDGRFTALGVKFNIKLNKMTSENLLPKINSIKRLLNIWKARNLTPLGKITVIKSLALPIITHLLTVLPDPDQSILKDIEDIFYHFIWNKPKGKVKKNLLKQEYSDGGLKMVDLVSYIKGLKISWIRRFLTKSDKWALFFQNKIPDSFFESGASQRDQIHLIDNPFWKDVALAWSEYNIILEPIDIHDILSEPIWFNKRIKLGYIKAWHKKGIVHVKHLFDEKGTLMSLEQLKNKFNIKATFLDVYRLHKAIPIQWLEQIKNKVTYIGAGPSIPLAIHSVYIAPKGCKYFYSLFHKKVDLAHVGSKDKWVRDLDIHIDNEEWKHFYMLPFRSSIDTNLRYFQYRILQRILTTNRFLFIIKVVDHDRCSFCNVASETLVHMFVECNIVSDVWNQLHAWLVKNGYTNYNPLLIGILFLELKV